MMNPNEIKLDKYLRIMWQINASDLFITWNLEPSVKVNGTVRKIDDVILDDEAVNELVEETFYGQTTSASSTTPSGRPTSPSSVRTPGVSV